MTAQVDNACADGSGPRDRRWLTAIYYLQEPGWDGGGALRLYVDDEASATGRAVDVEPIGDRLVLFFADRVVHEVGAPAWLQMASTPRLRRSQAKGLVASTPQRRRGSFAS